MNRRKARENAFLVMFEFSFGGELAQIIEFSRLETQDQTVDAFGEGLINNYAGHAEEIDQIIESKLKGWKVNRLPRVSLAMLRLAVAEMLYGEPDIDSVAINEAVEISKKYGDEGDYQFINGVLGSVSRERNPDATAQPAAELPL